MNKRTWFGWGVAVAAAVAAVALAGNTYYVDAGRGNDANPCTAAAPCRSYGRAEALAGGGDTIRFIGAYGSQVTVTKDNLVLDGGGTAMIDTTAQNGIDIRPGADGVTVRGFEITRTRSHSIHIEGNGALVENNRVHHAILENGTLNGDGTITCGNGGWGSGIKTSYDVQGAVIQNNIVHDVCGELIAATLSSGIIIRNNELYGNGKNVGIYVDNSFDVLVENNRVTCGVSNANGIATGEESYSGYGARFRDVIIRGNTVMNCRNGINAFSSEVGGVWRNVIIENNYIPSGISFGIAVNAASCENSFIRNNVVWTTYLWKRCGSGLTISGNSLPGVTVTPVTPTASRTPTPVITAVKTSTPTMMPATVTPTAACEEVYRNETVVILACPVR